MLPERVSALLVPLRRLVESLSIRDRLPQIEVAVADRADGAQIVLVLRVLNPPDDADRDRLSEFARHHEVELWLQPGGPQTAAPLSPQQPTELQLSLPEFGVTVPFGPTDFTQVNHGINQALVARALRLLDPQPHEKVIDFFCGLGNFTLPLATRAAHVWGIEGSTTLVERARVAAQANALADRTSFAAGNLFDWTAEDWNSALRTAGGVDKVLIDPPREGALAVVRALCRLVDATDTGGLRLVQSGHAGARLRGPGARGGLGRTRGRHRQHVPAYVARGIAGGARTAGGRSRGGGVRPRPKGRAC